MRLPYSFRRRHIYTTTRRAIVHKRNTLKVYFQNGLSRAAFGGFEFEFNTRDGTRVRKNAFTTYDKNGVDRTGVLGYKYYLANRVPLDAFVKKYLGWVKRVVLVKKLIRSA